MLIDHRTYRIKPTHMNTHLAIYEEFGLKAQWRHLGEPHAYMFAESGAMNSLALPTSTVLPVNPWMSATRRCLRRSALPIAPP